MSLQIIYGKAGSGKSELCFQQIKKKIEQKETVFIITPEQFSYTAEKKLLETIDTSAVFSAEVLTLERMAYRAIQQYGGRTQKRLSEAGKAMLLFELLQEEKKNLNFLGKSDENIKLVENTITEFKKHGIEVEMLEPMTKQMEENPYLQYKLKDMYLLYEKYQQAIKEQYLDENDLLTILAEKLDEIPDYDHTILYLDSFSGFTKQEQEVLRKLMKKAKDVIITITADGIEESFVPETDVFYSNKQTISKLYEIAKQENVPIKNPIYLGSLPRFQNKELLHLEENIYHMPYQIWEKEVKRDFLVFGGKSIFRDRRSSQTNSQISKRRRIPIP